jgi:hypothetical protein
MNKYRICEFIDGNGKTFYRIEKRSLFTWKYFKQYDSSGYCMGIIQWDTLKEAEYYLKDYIKYCNSLKTKKIKCYNYGEDYKS